MTTASPAPNEARTMATSLKTSSIRAADVWTASLKQDER